MGMSEPDGPGRKGACLLIPAMPLLAPQLLTSSLPALSNLGTQSADSWWLRVAWEFADPYVRAICEKMKGLEEYPGYGFAVQIDVTVDVQYDERGETSYYEATCVLSLIHI